MEVPALYVAGEHDWVTSPELARQYLDVLKEPGKAFVLFDRSGHVACFEEPQRFLEVMLRAKAVCGSEVLAPNGRAPAHA